MRTKPVPRPERPRPLTIFPREMRFALGVVRLAINLIESGQFTQAKLVLQDFYRAATDEE